MSDAIEIASAYVSLTTKMPGVKRDVEASLGDAEGVAASSGARAGAGYAAALAGAVLAATAVVAASVAGLFAAGEQIDSARDTIRIFTTETGASLEGLNKSVDNVAKETPAALDDIASTVATLHQRLGLTGGDLETVARQYLEAGRLFGEKVDVQATSGLFNIFKIGAGDVSTAMDTIFNASRVAGVGINDFSSTLATAAPAAQLLGLSFDETTGLFATLAKSGVDVNAAAAKLGPALTNLAKDGEAPAEAFKRIVGQIQDLATSGDTAGATLKAADLFGARGAAGFVAALAAGTVNLNDLAGSVDGVGDSILGVASETADAGESWKVLKNNALEAINPIASAVFDFAGKGLAKVVDWAKQNGPAISGFFTQLGTLLGPIISQVGQLTPLSLVFQALAPLLPQIMAAFAPLGPIIGQVAQIVGGLVAQIVPLVTSIIAQLLPALTPIIGIFLQIASVILPIISDVLPPLVDLLGLVLTPVIQVLSTVLQALAPVFDLIGGSISIVSGILQVLATIFGAVVQTIVAAMKGDFSSIPGIWQGVFDKIAGIAKSTFKNVLSFVQSGVNGLIDLINGLIGGVNSTTSKLGIAAIGKLGHVTFSTPGLAEGGLVSHRPGGMLATIGEGRYDEVVMPLSPKVLNNLAGAGGDRPIYADGIGLLGWIRELANGEAQLVWAQQDRAAAAATGMGRA